MAKAILEHLTLYQEYYDLRHQVYGQTFTLCVYWNDVRYLIRFVNYVLFKFSMVKWNIYK